MKKNNLFANRNRCFIIAEAGVNHNGSLALAKKLVDAAARAGADAVKFQTFRAESIVTPTAAQAAYQAKNTGRRESQFHMLKRLELSYADFAELKQYCDRHGIIFSSTPHSSREDVDLMAKLCPFIKVGSGDLTNLPMLTYIASKKLPVVLSTGMATMAEVREAVHAILPVNKKLILLHCTSNYPAPFSRVNLRAMATMAKAFGLPVGYSDHTEGITVSLAAAALGARVIEKHFTLDRSMPGPDHRSSLEPAELAVLVKGVRDIELALGDGVKKPHPGELPVARAARKSLVAAVALKKGTIVTPGMLAAKRPGTGISPALLPKVAGRKIRRDIPQNRLISWKDFSP